MLGRSTGSWLVSYDKVLSGVKYAYAHQEPDRATSVRARIYEDLLGTG